MYFSYRLDQSLKQTSKSTGEQTTLQNRGDYRSTDESENLLAISNFQVGLHGFHKLVTCIPNLQVFTDW